ncbi:hypothetical protein BDN72DRAFT_672250 [Pluteus cervinus]|uniref:Uncharacterized protein n=1 Tax=Pluteus cervinus TaxID=181527 RepID=A0ACD3BAL4_9AGAR|nr:hypothetical protein BDN72DRAFT_672250 [Pluteus cervinus]
MPTKTSSSSTRSSSSAGSSPTPPKPHAKFYRPDGDVVIQVENTLFKLHLKTLHEKSSVLRIVMPPVYEGQTRYLGFNDNKPFVLHEVRVADFVPLLRVLYPKDATFKKPMNIDDWLSVLKLSTQYQIADFRQQAVEQLDAAPLDPIRKIAIWEEYRLDPKHLISSYTVLCQRLEPLTLSMTLTLGLKNFTKLAAARDGFHRKMGCGSCMHGTFKERHAVAEEIVTDIFFPKL